MTRARRFWFWFALFYLMLVTVQLWLVFSAWSGSGRDVFQLVLAAVQLVLALTVIRTSLRTRKRGASQAAPPVDNSSADNAQ